MAPRTSPNPNRVLTFTEHLEELRVRIIIVLAVTVPCFLVGFYFSPAMLSLLIAPLTHMERPAPVRAPVFALEADGTLRLKEPAEMLELLARDGAAGTTATAEMEALVRGMGARQAQWELPDGTRVPLGGGRSATNLYYLSPVDPFFLIVKGALLISAVVVVPLAIYQFWLFVAPGLRRRERKVVKPILLSAFVLFPLGAAFAYFISHFALRALMAFGSRIPFLEPNIVAAEYLGFILMLMLAFGLIFEFPLLLVLLNRMGIVDSRTLAEKRRYAILLISVLAAIFTPPDPFSMIAGILPLVLLYEVSLWVIRAFERRDAAAAPGPPAASRQDSL